MDEINKMIDKILLVNQGQSWMFSFNFDLLTPEERLEYSHFCIANMNYYSWSLIVNFLEFSFSIMGAISKHITITLIF